MSKSAPATFSSEVDFLVESIIQNEARAILDLPRDNPYEGVVNLLHSRCILHRSKLLVTGVGKAGELGSKIATTFCSTGLPAVFLHPLEAVHGDLGLLQPHDCLLAISNSGETREVLELIPHARSLVPDLPVIGVTGDVSSELCKLSTFVLHTGSPEESCPLGLTPTSSLIAVATIGDILVHLLMRRTGFTHADYARRHHAGYLGVKARHPQPDEP